MVRGVILQMKLLAMLVMIALPALAQNERAVLIADRLELSNSNILLAEGHVEITYGGQRLNAPRVIYDQGLDRLFIEGPFTLDTGADLLVLAQGADLNSDMRNGVIQGARLVIDQRMQLTAAEMQSIDGRYRVLQNVAASSCQICTRNLTPLWEIRAKRVIHDTTEKQIYFDHAQFRVAGLPIFYVPRMRLPDPTLRRATGFLTPKFTLNTAVGFGVQTPYFIALGAHRDLTITPFVTDQNSRSLSLRYRQAFRTGDIALNGTYTRDKVLDDEVRFYGIATGAFQLPRNYTLTLRAETVSDAAYFQSYGLTEQDRLVTFAQIQRSSRELTVNGRVLGTQSIRSTENNATQPSLIADADAEHRYDLGQFGQASLSVKATARQRGSTDPLDGGDPDTNADGRDVTGFGLKAEWQKRAVLGYGVLATVQSELRADAYSVRQDATYEGDYGRITSSFGAQLRWPLTKTLANGATQILEPVGQIVYAPQSSGRLFNEDSSLVEFDEGNLFALNRFPGSEVLENGVRLNFGVNFTQRDPRGHAVTISLGRVFRAENLAQFSAASGLDGVNSDWLAAGKVDLGAMLSLRGRLLFDDDFAITKTEIRSKISGRRHQGTIGYLFAPEDLAEERANRISELSLSTNHQLSEYWSASTAARYDFISNNTARGSLGLVYRNECLLVDVSLSRRFASSTNIAASTDFGLSVSLLGFGGGDAGPTSQCRK